MAAEPPPSGGHAGTALRNHTPVGADHGITCRLPVVTRW
jgi:hypothetical protein